MSIRRMAAAVAAVVAASVLTGTSGAPASSGRVVLSMAARDSDLGGDPAVADFVARVERVSRGRLQIDALGGWGNFQRGVEQQIVRDVAAGRVDLGAVGTRVFDTLGVR